MYTVNTLTYCTVPHKLYTYDISIKSWRNTITLKTLVVKKTSSLCVLFPEGCKPAQQKHGRTRCPAPQESQWTPGAPSFFSGLIQNCTHWLLRFFIHLYRLTRASINPTNIEDMPHHQVICAFLEFSWSSSTKALCFPLDEVKGLWKHPPGQSSGLVYSRAPSHNKHNLAHLVALS